MLKFGSLSPSAEFDGILGYFLLIKMLSMSYNRTMKHKFEDSKRASVYFPVALLTKLQESAKQHRRSFNQEVMWRLEQSYALPNGESKIVVER